MVTLDSHSNIYADTSHTFAVYPATNGAVYQSFKTPDGNHYTLDSFKWLMLKGASGTTCTFQTELYAHTGTYGTSSAPTGAALATSNQVTQTSISTAYTLVTFTFAAPPTLEPDTAYVAVIKCTALGGTSTLVWLGVDAVAPTHAGNGGVWTAT